MSADTSAIKAGPYSGATLHWLPASHGAHDVICDISGEPIMPEGMFFLELRLVDWTRLTVRLTDAATGLLCGWVGLVTYGGRVRVQVCRLPAPRPQFTAVYGFGALNLDCAVEYDARTGRLNVQMGSRAYLPFDFPAADDMRFQLQLEETPGSMTEWAVGVISFATPLTRVEMLLRTRELVLTGRAHPAAAAGTDGVAAWLAGVAPLSVVKRVCWLLKGA